MAKSTTPMPCPSWCTRSHTTTYATHERVIAEFTTDSGLITTVGVAQHHQPNHPHRPVVRLLTHTDEASSITDFMPSVAAHLGHVLTAIDGHDLGAALTTAAATLLVEGSGQ